MEVLMVTFGNSRGQVGKTIRKRPNGFRVSAPFRWFLGFREPGTNVVYFYEIYQKIVGFRAVWIRGDLCPENGTYVSSFLRFLGGPVSVSLVLLPKLSNLWKPKMLNG